MIKVYVTDVSNIDVSKILKYQFLSDVRRNKINKLRNDKDKTLSFGCEILLNKAIKELKPKYELPVKYEYDKFGKPYLVDLPYSISFSHSLNKVVLAISNKNIGIDIQHHDEIKYERVAKRYFGDLEAKIIISPLDFYETWVKKEAYGKFTGLGLASTIKQNILISDHYNKKYQCYCSLLNIDEDYSCCVISEKEEDIKVIKI